MDPKTMEAALDVKATWTILDQGEAGVFVHAWLTSRSEVEVLERIEVGERPVQALERAKKMLVAQVECMIETYPLPSLGGGMIDLATA